MKILKEAKENLPVAFLTSFVSDGWEKIGILKEEIEAIKKEFKGTKKIEDLIQNLIDAYLVCIGQMEQYLADKDYLDIDDKKDVKEALNESSSELVEPIEAKKFEDNNKTEIFTELPDYDVEVEQKGDKVEIELEPKGKMPAVSLPIDDLKVQEENPKYAVSDDEMDAFEKAIMAAKPLTDGKSDFEEIDTLEDSVITDNKKTAVAECDWFCDFEAPVGEKLTDNDLYPENKAE